MGNILGGDEGDEAVKRSDLGTLRYFGIRARGEPIRLTLALANVEWNEEPVDYETKQLAGSDKLPFGQWPLWFEPESEEPLSQMDAIVRFLGRKYHLYDRDATETCKIDEVLVACENIRDKYGQLIYKSSFDMEAIKSYVSLHVDELGLTSRNGGAHLQYLENFLSRNGERWMAGGDLPSIADAMVFDVYELHVILLEKHDFKMTERFPLLNSHRNRFQEIQSVANYLESARRKSKVNGNDRM